MTFARGFLTKPAVKKLLAPEGPRPCCEEWAIVTDCDGETDHLFCGICDFRWSRPCSVSDVVAVN